MNSGVSGVFACIASIHEGDGRAPRRRYPAPRRTLRAVLRSTGALAARLWKALTSRWFGRPRGVLHIPSIVRSVLAYHTHHDSNEVRGSEHLYGDLGLTSLGLVMAALDLEDILGFQLDPNDLSSMQTVADLLRATENAVGARRPLGFAREVPTVRAQGRACAIAPCEKAETSLRPFGMSSATTPK